MTGCPACGTLCIESANFCPACGQRLRASGGTAVGAQSARPPIERRQLTVMFCDLVASTRLSLELDAEDFTATVSAYRDACARVVRRWRGYISRYVGDGLLIYFGYPQAAEDDALRAVAAAWDLTQAIGRLELPAAGPARADRPRRQLQIRIGLHTGLVVVGDVIGRDSAETDVALGAAPNIASRMQGLCQPGEIVISDATAALLPPSVRLARLDRAAERADFGPVTAYIVEDVPQDLAPGRPPSAGQLVGRQATLERLVGCLRESTGGLVALHLRGDPGLGKSRLVQALVEHPGMPQPHWIRVGCSAYGQYSPLHPFREWIAESDSAADEAGSPGQTADVSPYDRRRRTFAALRVALRDQASHVALAIEDMHWADSTTVDFVAELLADAPVSGFFLVMTSRRVPDELLAATGRLQVETLDRLSPGEAAMLARAVATARPLTAFELAEIVDHADGVPLFVEEFVRAITARDGGADGIPITLRDSLMGLLDTLGGGRTVALCASVFGRRFEYRHLRALLAVDDSELVSALEALTRAQVLVQVGEIPEASFEFRHALLRDTAYHTLLKSERARWHGRVAELAAGGALAIEESMPELLATHHSLGGNRRAAIRYWLLAQDRAMHRSAHAEALAHLRSGLEDCRHLAQDEPEEAARLELELLRRQAAPLIAIAGWSAPELEQVYARAMALCRTEDEEETKFELERGLYNMHLLRSDLRTADRIASRLLATAEGAANTERHETLMLVALRSKALPAFYGGDFDGARKLLEQVLALHDPGRHAGHARRYGTDPVMLALSYLAWMDAVEGDAFGAKLRVADALRRARGESHDFSLCYALCFAASVAQMCGQVDDAAAHALEARQLANHHNFPYWIAWARAVHGWVVGTASPEHGIELIEAARRTYLATGSSLVAPYFEALACKLAMSAGHPQHAAWRARLYAHGCATGVWFWEGVLAGTGVDDSAETPALPRTTSS